MPRHEKGSALLTCTKCRESIPEEFHNTGTLWPCPSCKALLQVNVFPALNRGPDIGSSGDKILVEDEASCFYHPQKKAVVPCSVCGRFLCALCDVELDGRHLCPMCLESGKRKHQIKNLENRRTLYDTMALALALLPMLFIWPTLVTAPLTLFLVIRYWKAPSSIVQRTKLRFILAGLLATAQMVAWAIFFVS